MNAIDKNAAILWAREIIANPNNYYILDTETTGLENPEVIELAMIDLHGSMIVDQRLRPKSWIDPSAARVHGITNEMLVNCPEWGLIADRLGTILNERTVLIYNANFDNVAICNSYNAHGVYYPGFASECVMEWFSQFIGEWNNIQGRYRWQKLPSGDHSAIGDCLATLEVIKGMAATKLETELTEHLIPSHAI